MTGPDATGSIYQATCVSIGGRAVLIEGEPGSGKSSLALALIDRGARLVGDDGVTLRLRDGGLWADPPPNTAGMLEIRNVGIVQTRAEGAPVSLVLLLDRAAARHVERAEEATRAGVRLPLIRLWPDSPVLALRAEWALAIHGAGNATG